MFHLKGTVKGNNKSVWNDEILFENSIVFYIAIIGSLLERKEGEVKILIARCRFSMPECLYDVNNFEVLYFGDIGSVKLPEPCCANFLASL